MKTITLYEPWATWVGLKWKKIETRTHDRFKCLAGQRIAIHAGLKFDKFWPEAACDYLTDEQKCFMLRVASSVDGGMLHGRILCTAFVAEARRLAMGDSKLALCDCGRGDRFGLVFADVRPVEGYPKARGHQGVWDWEPDEQ